MFENIIGFFKKLNKKEEDKTNKDTAKERLHLVLMQDRANVSADFLEMMKQEIIDVIKKYIDVDESEIDVKLTNKQNSDGTTGAPALYANIPIISIKNETRKITKNSSSEESQLPNNKKLNEIKSNEPNKGIEKNEAKDNESSNKEKSKIKNSENDNTEKSETKNSENSNEEESKTKNIEKDSTEKKQIKNNSNNSETKSEKNNKMLNENQQKKRINKKFQSKIKNRGQE